MGITGMNHAVLYVRDARRQQRFYERRARIQPVIVDDPDGHYVFMRAPAWQNHHDIAFFSIGDQAGPPRTGPRRSGCTTSPGRCARSTSSPPCAPGSPPPAPSSAPATTAPTRASTPRTLTASSSR